MAKSVAKNALYSGIRTISFMLFPLVTYPYVTRVLLADNLGKVDFSTSFVSYFTLIAGLGVTTYATREGAKLRDDRQRLDRFSSEVFTINMVSTVCAYALLALFVLLWPHLEGYLSLIAIQSLTIIGTTIGVEWVFGLEEEYGYITARTVVVQLISAILLFALVKTSSDYVIYAAIVALSGVGGNVFNWFRARRYTHIRLTWNFDYRRHLIPMLVLFGNAIAVTIYVNIDVSLLNVMRGDYEVGIYGLAVKIYRMVKQLLNAIITVALPRLSLYVGQQNRSAYDTLLGRMAHALIIVVTPALTLLLLMSQDVVLVVGGEGFGAATPSLQILSLACVFAVTANFFVSAVLLPFGKETRVLRATAWGAVINLALNLLCIPVAGAAGAAVTTVMAEMCVTLLSIWNCRTDIDLRSLARSTQPAAVTAAVGMLAMCALHPALQQLPMPWHASFVIRGLALAGIYVCVLMARKDALVHAALDSARQRVRRRPS